VNRVTAISDHAAVAAERFDHGPIPKPAPSGHWSPRSQIADCSVNGCVHRLHLKARTLESALLRVSALVDDVSQIAELDCNPFVVHGEAQLSSTRVSALPPSGRVRSGQFAGKSIAVNHVESRPWASSSFGDLAFLRLVL
jgi:hypothetical protein